MRLLWWRMRYRIRRRLLPGLRRERLEHSYIFGPPTSRPHLSPAEARHIAAPQAPPTARIRADYVRCEEPNRERGSEQPDGSIRWERIPPFDAWKVLVTGIFVPRPSGRSGAPASSRPPPVTTMLVIVDDKKGAYHSAVGE